jgi:hypothetical protein
MVFLAWLGKLPLKPEISQQPAEMLRYLEMNKKRDFGAFFTD